jgi:hypothetical protein
MQKVLVDGTPKELNKKIQFKEKIWIPKAICLISTQPYFDFFTIILNDLYFSCFHDELTDYKGT